MIRVAITDDEPLARKVMESYLKEVPGFELADTCKNAFELLTLLNKEQIDLVLLDIDIPGINGIDFIRTLKEPPLVIFTTAYTQYAPESYELNALDYLVKPIALERFVKALNKVGPALKQRQQPMQTKEPSTDPLLFVRSEGKWVKIDLQEIRFVEGVKDYIRLWMEKSRVVIHSTMKSFEEQLAPFPQFIRVHKSYIVNLQFVEEIDGNSLKIQDQLIGIGGTYREEVHRRIDGYKMGG